MKYLIILLSSILFGSCANRYLNYDFEMDHPVKSKQLYYENDSFSIAYEMRQQYIEFTILNKLNDGLRINWDEVSFSINGKTYRAVHKETGVYKINDVQPPTTIPPKSSLNDFIIPSDNIRYSNVTTRSYYIAKDIFPVEATGKKKLAKAISTYRGTKITIFMPFYVSGKYQSYYYDIIVRNITDSKNPTAKTPLPKK